MDSSLDITVLCRVVDNYGDIGFVYRLSRALMEKSARVSVRLVVSDLRAFALMLPSVDVTVPEQQADGITVLDWNDAATCTEHFTRHPPAVLFECFECGRPEWLEALLFPVTPAECPPRTVQIVSIEYLSAEPWVEEFHLLPSATRSRFVKKLNFMPGFTKKTGGLVLDRNFMRCACDRQYALTRVLPLLSRPCADALCSKETCCVLMFSYEKEFAPVIDALSALASRTRLVVLSACDSFDRSCSCRKLPFRIESLPPLPQTEWDALLCSCDFLFVRGEDSFSRACLSGIPFLWEAYVQKDAQQLVKADALLSRMEPFFPAEEFRALRAAFLSYNCASRADCGPDALDVLSSCPDATEYAGCAPHVARMLRNFPSMAGGFRKFAASLVENGCAAEHLLTLLGQLQF